MVVLRRQMLSLVLAASSGGAGCGGSDEAGAWDMQAVNTRSPNQLLHWSYIGEAGPERWGELGADFTTCRTGRQQSPIDIPAALAPAPLSALTFDYAPAPASIVDTGHTIRVSFAEGANVLSIDGEDFALLELHFHAHSEHAIGGLHTPLEMHLVHRSASGALAVLGVFLNTDAAVSPLAPVFEAMPEAGPQPTVLAGELDPAELLPRSKDGWTYSGSLTTPPCTEGVRWHVLASEVSISEAQLAAFTQRYASSRRPVMPNGSVITSGN